MAMYKVSRRNGRVTCDMLSAFAARSGASGAGAGVNPAPGASGHLRRAD